MTTGPASPESNPAAIPLPESTRGIGRVASAYGVPDGEPVSAAVADRSVEDVTRPLVLAAPVTLGLGAIPVRRADPATDPSRAATPPFPQARFAVLALAGCGVLSFPLYRDGASVRVYGLALAVSVLCVFLALVLAVRTTVPTLAVAVMVPATVAAGQLLEGGPVHSAGLSRALDLALAPAWIAGTAGVVASLAALTSLVARLAWQMPRGTTDRPMAEATRSTD
ncbi:hypothetical protein [Streptomyces sp. NBC_00076]|uniref:hypothetical protein n=1 Tax=Streptomyces sp. NBC_00076 TaxID=2975642 RepID=UPI0032540428